MALAPVRDPVLVGQTIAQTLSLRKQADESMIETLKTHLRDKQMLLILDNFEHILPAAPLISDLLAGASRLKIMVTSRASLQLYGEWDYLVPSLTLPDPSQSLSLEQVAAYDAIQLFVERARAVTPEFKLNAENGPTIAQICRMLDGLPLAIELAAARMRWLTPQNILAHMGHRLEVLVEGPKDVPARQQTLRQTIDWSYDLLDAPEKQVFERLAVFVGGCTMPAAEAVCHSASAPKVLPNLKMGAYPGGASG